jgi:protein-L-isoaspartate(D-aspartate) O-methyltransferase
MDKQQLLQYWKMNFTFKDSVIKAFRKINREDYVMPSLRKRAYEDAPLPILRGKTISQPSTVMLMTDALDLKKGEKVFEVGSGSGYQAAIISQIIGKSGKVITTEVIPELVQLAKKNLKTLKNVIILEEDGSKGMPEEAPFDKIIITAACREFPRNLIDQLKTGGIIIGPVGFREEQTMVKGIKQDYGRLELEFLGSFIFTPMYGKYGFEI